MEILNKTSYHFIGIGGIGISAIARMLALQGKKVTGSDNSASLITEDLQKLGIEVAIGQRAENVPKDAEAVIYTVAVKEDNPELMEAKKRGLECVSYPQFLGELSKKMFTIALSGTHGKTTTTAMIGHIMREAGLDPTIIVGSKMLDLENSNFHAGRSDYLVVEACEYKRSFLNLHPKILVITNIEAEHLDYYKDLADIRSAFEEMKSKVPEDGKIIGEAEYEKIKTDFELLVPGKHNIANAQAAVAAALALGISEERAKEALKTFRGTWRRLEYKGERDDKVFYDDYAHHPTETEASLRALREKYPDRELVCIFQPHRISRIKSLFSNFVSALRLADRVFITPVYAASEAPDDSISNRILADEVSKSVPAAAVQNPSEIKLEAQKPQCVVLMGAGDIYQWTQKIMDSIISPASRLESLEPR